jgi:hypothetical protein
MASSTSKAARSAPEALKILWEEGFFREWRKKAQIDSALAKRGNHFTDAELLMALLRAKHLTRRGKRGSYEYIQKYPHEIEPKAATPKARKARGRKH